MYKNFVTILSVFILLINSNVVQAADVGGQFSGGTLGFTIDRRSDRKRTANLFLITGWVLGKGPCGPGCNKSDIGRSTLSTRSLWPSYHGNFTAEYIDSGTVTIPINNEVDKTYNETIIGVSDYDKWEQELLHFSVDMPDGYHSFIINFDGFSWRAFTSQNSWPAPRFDAKMQNALEKVAWHFQVLIKDEIRNDTGKPNQSPIAIAKPVYRIKLGDVTELRIPVVDRDGDFIRCSLPVFVEAGRIGDSNIPQNVHISENCSVFVNSSMGDGYIDDTWILVPISVRDYPRNNVIVGPDHYETGKYSFSAITVQFSVHVVSQLEGPEFVHPTPEGNHLFYIYSGATWKTDIYCQAVPNTTIASLTTFGLQNENFTLTALKQDQTRLQLKSSTMSWLPSAVDTGNHIACVNAIDDTGTESSEQRCFILELKADVFNHTTRVFADKPYFIDVPAPGQYIPCLIGTTCFVPLFVKSDISLRYVNITKDYIDESKLWPFENVKHRGAPMFKADFSFKHSVPGIVLACFTAVDSNMNSSEELCIHIEIETPDPCLSAPCLNSATCLRDKSYGGFICVCYPGTLGRFCEIRDYPCSHNPCDDQGTDRCFDFGVKFYCWCNAGFTGITCDTDIDDCRNDSCNGHGLCRDGVNSVSCTCFDRYNGSRCENDKCPAQKNGEPTCSEAGIPCTRNPCNAHGTIDCLDVNDKFYCFCKSGFTGITCHENINDCQNDSCNGHGTCKDQVNDYACECFDRYNGTRCEYDRCPTLKNGEMTCPKESDLCVPNPCIRGTCYHHQMQYYCACPSGYTGKNCEMKLNPDPCEQNPCVRGTCFSHASDFLCTCPLGYTGQLCETTYVQVRVGNAFSMNCTDPGMKSTPFFWSKANACGGKYDAVKGYVFNEQHAVVGDSGLYSCTASDAHGTNVTKHFLVDVTSPKQEEMCDFDDGTLCGWHQDTNDDFDWTSQNGPTESDGTGPNNDHTLGTSKGKYLYVESSSPRNIGEYASLTSPIQVANQTMCFEFWYYMFGDGIGGLFVLLQDSCTRNEQQIFKESGNQGEIWNKASLTISSQLVPNDYRIMIKADVGVTFHGDTSIDDLVIRKGQCPDEHGVPIIG